MKTMGQIVANTGQKMLEIRGVKIQMACRHNNYPSEGACGACWSAVTLALGDIREALERDSDVHGQVETILSNLSEILTGQKEKPKR